MTDLNVVIVTARCRHSHEMFGIRVEETGVRRWQMTWAFSIAEAMARREGYTNQTISGRFSFAGLYPGCPYCHTKGLVKCQCDRLGCWDARSDEYICPWCQARGKVGGTADRLTAGADR